MDAGRKQETFWRGIDCFNRRKFFECHEVLEEIWLQEPETEKPFYQGLIQVAAGFHQLLEKKNPRGAASLLRRGMKKLEPYPPHSHGLDLAALLAQLAPWLDRLAHGQPTDDLPLPRIHPAV
ncbi:MAG: DUF309 domain-containing protein [Candidatus Acidoferrales bacterium]